MTEDRPAQLYRLWRLYYGPKCGKGIWMTYNAQMILETAPCLMTIGG